MCLQRAEARLHSKFFQLKPLQSVELIGVFFHTQVGDFSASDSKSCSPVFGEVVFQEDESYSDPLVLYIPTGCS